MTGWLATGIAFAVFFFTIFSFWWMNWRVGKLVVTVPSTYAASSGGNRLTLLLPLVFFNRGPVPHVVRNLRIRFEDEPDGFPLEFHSIRSGVNPSQHDQVDLAAPFPVPGNQTVRLFCEYIRIPTGRTLNAGTYSLVLETLTDKRPGWYRLLSLPLTVDRNAEEHIPARYIAYANPVAE